MNQERDIPSRSGSTPEPAISLRGHVRAPRDDRARVTVLEIGRHDDHDQGPHATRAARRVVVGASLAFALGAALGSGLFDAVTERSNAALATATVTAGAVRIGSGDHSHAADMSQPERSQRAWSDRLTREAVEHWGVTVGCGVTATTPPGRQPAPNH